MDDEILTQNTEESEQVLSGSSTDETEDLTENILEDLPGEPEPLASLSENTLSDGSVSENAVTVIDNETLNQILEEIRGIRNDIQSISANAVSADLPVDVLSSNEVQHVVSQNLINTPLNEYGLTDSILLMILVSLTCAGLIYVVRRLILKWI